MWRLESATGRNEQTWLEFPVTLKAGLGRRLWREKFFGNVRYVYDPVGETDRRPVKSASMGGSPRQLQGDEVHMGGGNHGYLARERM